MACPQQIKVAALMKPELFKHRKLFGQLTLSYSSKRNTSPAARENSGRKYSWDAAPEPCVLLSHTRQCHPTAQSVG